MIQIPVLETTLRPANMKISKFFKYYLQLGVRTDRWYVLRMALVGFRSGWRPKTAPSILGVNSFAEPAKVDRIDYAADGSEDDRKESSSMSITRKPTKDNELSKVCPNESYFNQL